MDATFNSDLLQTVALISRSFRPPKRSFSHFPFFDIEEEMQDQATSSIAASSLPSSSERSSSSALQLELKEGPLNILYFSVCFIQNFKIHMYFFFFSIVAALNFETFQFLNDGKSLFLVLLAYFCA